MRGRLYLGVVSAALGCVLTSTSCGRNPYTQGKLIYEYKCANCHQPDGAGLVGNIPPLAQSDWLVENREEIACVIRYGLQGELVVNGLTYEAKMAGHPDLSDTEVANVANYILYAWDNGLPELPPAGVGDLLEACEAKGFEPITD